MKKQIYEKLPKAFKNKWLKALRSGEFQQGKTYLENKLDDDSSSYCCIGVACRIMHPNKKLKGFGWINSDLGRLRDLKVPKMLHGDGSENVLVAKLANMNDSGKSFKVIANFIEKNL